MALDHWIAYLQKLEGERTALQNAPQEPAFSPEVVAQRRATNQREQMLGTLGQLTDDEPMQRVGGTYLKNAIENAKERVSDKGITNPIDGTTSYFPEYIREKKQTALDGRLDRGMQGYLKSIDSRDLAAQRSADVRERRRDIDGLADALGTGQHTPIGTSDKGSDVFRTKKGQIYVYDDRGQPQQYTGKMYNKGVIPAQTVREIAEKKAYLGEHDNFAKSYKPEFAGTAPIIGKIEAAVGRYTGGVAQPMAEWWQNYRNWTINLRRDLFGTALTAPEKALFDEANIEPGMHTDTITRRMEQQQLAIARAVNKVQESYKGHYGMDPVPEPNIQAPGAAPASPVSVWNRQGPLGQFISGRSRAQTMPGPVSQPSVPPPQSPGVAPGAPVESSVAPAIHPDPIKQKRLEELRRLQRPNP